LQWPGQRAQPEWHPIASASIDRELPSRGWNIFLGIIGLLAGFAVLATPGYPLWKLALAVGLCLMIMGVMKSCSPSDSASWPTTSTRW
jgi:hypothetical protein